MRRLVISKWLADRLKPKEPFARVSHNGAGRFIIEPTVTEHGAHRILIDKTNKKRYLNVSISGLSEEHFPSQKYYARIRGRSFEAYGRYGTLEGLGDE